MKAFIDVHNFPGLDSTRITHVNEARNLSFKIL